MMELHLLKKKMSALQKIDSPIRASVEHGLSWAVAGRSEGKLQAVLDRAGKAVAADLSSTPVIVSAN